MYRIPLRIVLTDAHSTYRKTEAYLNTMLIYMCI